MSYFVSQYALYVLDKVFISSEKTFTSDNCYTHFVRYFDKQAETLRGLKRHSAGDVQTEIFCFCA